MSTICFAYVWLTQDMIATLYEKGRSTITEYLKNTFLYDELDENSTYGKFQRGATNGKEYNTKLKDFSIRGYVMNNERLKNGTFLNEDYFNHLIEVIREIRASERKLKHYF